MVSECQDVLKATCDILKGAQRPDAGEVRGDRKEILNFSVQDIAFELDSFTMGLKISQFLKLKQPNAQA
jgi:hypothetical protein